MLKKIAEQSPLIHNITNYVVMNPTANALLAIGASPVMAHAVDEVEQMAALSSALVINLGTLSPLWVEASLRAMIAAKGAGVPIVYDPVGAGATNYRNRVNEELLGRVKPTIIRGNASEIMALSGLKISTRGVDSSCSGESAIEAAQSLSQSTGAVVVVSGPTDYIVSGKTILENHHGTPMMTRVTGMGCTATAICGAFVAVSPMDALNAAHGAMTLMGRAGEQAAQVAQGPGSFQVAFLDTLYALSLKGFQE